MSDVTKSPGPKAKTKEKDKQKEGSSRKRGRRKSPPPVRRSSGRRRRGTPPRSKRPQPRGQPTTPREELKPKGLSRRLTAPATRLRHSKSVDTRPSRPKLKSMSRQSSRTDLPTKKPSMKNRPEIGRVKSVPMGGQKKVVKKRKGKNDGPIEQAEALGVQARQLEKKKRFGLAFETWTNAVECLEEGVKKARKFNEKRKLADAIKKFKRDLKRCEKKRKIRKEYKTKQAKEQLKKAQQEGGPLTALAQALLNKEAGGPSPRKPSTTVSVASEPGNPSNEKQDSNFLEMPMQQPSDLEGSPDQATPEPSTVTVTVTQPSPEPSPGATPEPSKANTVMKHSPEPSRRDSPQPDIASPEPPGHQAPRTPEAVRKGSPPPEFDDDEPPEPAPSLPSEQTEFKEGSDTLPSVPLGMDPTGPGQGEGEEEEGRTSSPRRKLHFKDLVGLEKVKFTLYESMLLPMLRPDVFRGLRAAPKGVLLFGTDGSGKTSLAFTLASEAKIPLYHIPFRQTLANSDPLGHVKGVFNKARESTKSIVFLDELEELAPGRRRQSNADPSKSSRSYAQDEELLRNLMKEIHSYLDQVFQEASSRIFVLGATRTPHLLDKKLTKRFAKKFLVPNPPARTRAGVLYTLLKGQSNDLSHKDLIDLGHKTTNYSCWDLMSLARDAAMGPIRDSGLNIVSMSPSDLPPINKRHFEESLRYITPSLSDKVMRNYQHYNEKNGTKLDYKSGQLPAVMRSEADLLWKNAYSPEKSNNRYK